MPNVGWLLDANIDYDRNALTLWIKVDGKTRGYTYYRFHPSVYVDTELMGSPGWPDPEILRMVKEHPNVTRVEIVQRFVSVYDDERKRVLQVFTTPDAHRQLAVDFEKLPGATVYHGDIDPMQQFFITNDIFPFGRVEFESEEDVITHIRCLDRREDVVYEIPELEKAWLDVFVDTNLLFPKPEDPIHHIIIHHGSRMIRIEDLDEREMLFQLQKTIDEIDPDIIITRGGDEELFSYLTMRAKLNEIQLVLSRDGTPLKVTQREPTSFWQYNQVVYRPGNQVMFRGRMHIDATRGGGTPVDRGAIAGIVEGCRLAYCQPQRTARMSIGTVNAAIQYYNAFKMGILIPPIKRNPEILKTINHLIAIDRGGLVFQPKPDIYENVAECDFASMYPTLMVTRNISPETICTRQSCPYNEQYCIEIPELPFRICNRKRGLVSKSLELVIQKRLAFKSLINQGHEAEKYKLMQNALKGVLVSCFGYLGFKNARFGRVEAHTAVTALARDVLLETHEIAESMGLRLVHGIVDSVWLKPEEDTDADYDTIEKFCSRVHKAVDIRMSTKGFYRWLVIPSSRLHPSIAPLNRYYGVYKNGSIKTRGIETRRRDTCLYVGDCQHAMIQALAHGRNKEEFLASMPIAYSVCQDYIDRLWEGDVDIRDLILHSRLTREPHEYRAASRAATVAKQLIKSGKELHAGQKVRYILTDSDAETAGRRAKAIELIDESTRYDPEAYAKLCVRAFENLIPAQYLTNDKRVELEQFVLA